LRQPRLTDPDRRCRLETGADRRIAGVGVGPSRQTEREAAADGRADKSIAHVLKHRRDDDASPSFQVLFWHTGTSVEKQC
jgi:hypothetical protein